jgi:hypothetical protein
MNRNKAYAIFGAAILTMSIAGVALAADLLEGQVGIELSAKDAAGSSTCLNFPLEIGDGEIGVHFVLTQPDADSGTLDATFSTDSFSGVASSGPNQGSLQWFAVITGDGDTTILSAHTDVTGGDLKLSHTCSSTTTETTSSSSESSSSSETTSFSQSESGSTTSSESTSFSQSESGTTDVTQPPTDTIGGNGAGQQSSAMWLLIASLGVLLGSVIVLAPSRAKNRD